MTCTSCANCTLLAEVSALYRQAAFYVRGDGLYPEATGLFDGARAEELKRAELRELIDKRGEVRYLGDRCSGDGIAVGDRLRFLREKSVIGYEGVVRSVDPTTRMVTFGDGRVEHADALRTSAYDSHDDWDAYPGLGKTGAAFVYATKVSGWLRVARDEPAAAPAAAASEPRAKPRSEARQEPSVAAKVVEYGPKIAAGVAVAAGVVAAARLAWEQPEVKLAAHLVRSKLGDVLGDLRREIARRAAGPEGGGNKSDKETSR